MVDASRQAARMWDVSIPEAVAIQRELRKHIVPQPPAGFAPRLVAGADISFDPGGDHAFAGIVVVDVVSMQTVASASVRAEIRFPYVPGLLSFREIPPLERAWAALEMRPDVMIFDGAGYAHPRRCGLACHAGLVFGVPSIGCAKSILVGTHGPLGPERGATADLVHRGEVVGMAVRLRANVQPVYVSIGHLIDLPTAVAVVESVTTRFRLPETTRRAHHVVNEARRAATPG